MRSYLSPSLVFATYLTSFCVFTFLVQRRLGFSTLTFDLLREDEILSKDDVTQFVDPLIGTYSGSQPGNVFGGASVPFGMAKIGSDVDLYAPPGYMSNTHAKITSISLFHDSGTGGGQSFGNFGSMPIYCENDEILKCGVTKTSRMQLRQMGDNGFSRDTSTPGYFKSYLEDNTTLEATSTRRAGLIRYTWNSNETKPFITFDWTQNKGDDFRGTGHLEIVKGEDGRAQRILLNGTYASSWAEEQFGYSAFGCIDLTAGGLQTVDQFGIWSADRIDQDVKIVINQTEADGSDPEQKYKRHRGVVLSYVNGSQPAGNTQIILRTGISFLSAEKACQNAEDEIPHFNFARVVQESKQQWQNKLSRIELHNGTDAGIRKLFYSSFYRSFLSPNNATGEAPGVYEGTPYPYFDGMYCSWDTFRTFFPLLSLTSGQDYADITETYIDSWRKEGYIVECRANTASGLVQGGSDGVQIIADFAVKYRNAELGVNMKDLYASLWNDATNDSKTFIRGGRQINVYEKYGYLPSDYIEEGVKGYQIVQSSKTAEYAFNDFGIRNVALMLGKKKDAERLTNRALFYKNLYDPTVESFNFKSFMQRRLMNGSFDNEDPVHCSPIDTIRGRSCGYGKSTFGGFYESSSWEYSFYVPHDFAGLISLVSNNSNQNFIDRLDTFFDRRLFFSADEPSFQTPLTYHYANAPTKSVDRVRKLILQEYGLETGSLPGNDDNGAMASLAIFHLLGLYPVPSTKEFLIGSPFIPGYTIHNTQFGSVNITVNGFDPIILKSRGARVNQNTKAYVKSVSINGIQQSSRCKIGFDDLFPAAAIKRSAPMHTEIIFDLGTKEEVQDCGSNADDIPSSLSTGGFASF